jgi:hypothetical protein
MMETIARAQDRSVAGVSDEEIETMTVAKPRRIPAIA